MIVGRADLVAACARASARARGARRQGDARRAAARRARVPRRATRPTLPVVADGCGAGRRAAGPGRSDRRARSPGATVVDTEAVAGGGSLPGLTIPSVGVAVDVADADAALARLRAPRRGRTRSSDDAVVCDLRTVDPADDDAARRRARGARVSRCASAVATAGHVDHGKSSLVLALTGTDPDRFPEEKARGLTIDLGLRVRDAAVGHRGRASSTCPGTCASSRTCSPEWARSTSRCSWSRRPRAGCPRPRSTCASSSCSACEHGMVAITKADLVDDETLELAELEIDRAPRGHGARARCRSWCATRCPGRGLDDVRATLDAVLAGGAGGARRRSTAALGRPRVRGEGRRAPSSPARSPAATVARRRRARGRGAAARGCACAASRPHGATSTTSGPGNRVALNLVGVDHHDLARGDALVRAGQWTHADRRRRARSDAFPARSCARRGRVQVYVGSGEHGATLRVLDRRRRVRPAALRRPAPARARRPARAARPGPRTHGRRRRGARRRRRVRKAADATESLGLPLGARLMRAHRVARGRRPPAGRRAPGGRRRRASSPTWSASGAAERVGDWLVEPATRERAAGRGARRASRAPPRRSRPTPGLELAALASALARGPGATARARSTTQPGSSSSAAWCATSAHVRRRGETPEAASAGRPRSTRRRSHRRHRPTSARRSRSCARCVRDGVARRPRRRGVHRRGARRGPSTG